MYCTINLEHLHRSIHFVVLFVCVLDTGILSVSVIIVPVYVCLNVLLCLIGQYVYVFLLLFFFQAESNSGQTTLTPPLMISLSAMYVSVLPILGFFFLSFFCFFLFCFVLFFFSPSLFLSFFSPLFFFYC